MAVLLRKMLGIGRMPDDMRSRIEAEGLIHLAEFVPVTFRFSGKVPGKTAKGSIRSLVGALALTHRGALATLSTAPRKAGRSVDHPWDAEPGAMATATLDEHGLILDATDISVVDARMAGSVSLHYKSPLTDEVLLALPQRSFTFDVTPKFVYSACGVTTPST